MNPRYYVTTWDAEKQQYTPQRGVRTGPYSLFGLRRAIRKLRNCGYSCEYNSKMYSYCDPAVLIKKTLDTPESDGDTQEP